MTDRQLDALRRLLPEWGFRVERNGHLCWRIGDEAFCSALGVHADHLCGEIERALLAREGVEYLSAAWVGTGWLVSYRGSWKGDDFTGFADSKLSAYLAVLEEVAG